MMLRNVRSLMMFVVAAAIGSQAQASFVPFLTSPPAGGSSSTFVYNLVFASNGATETLTSGNLVTLYDFDAGVTLGNIVAPGFTVTIQNVGINPNPSIGTINPNDNPNISNISFVYTGATLSSDAAFGVTITLPGVFTTRVGQYSSQNNSIAPGGTNTQLGSVLVPNPVIPEPTSVVLAGLGFCGVLGLSVRRNRRAQA